MFQVSLENAIAKMDFSMLVHKEKATKENKLDKKVRTLCLSENNNRQDAQLNSKNKFTLYIMKDLKN